MSRATGPSLTAHKVLWDHLESLAVVEPRLRAWIAAAGPLPDGNALPQIVAHSIAEQLAMLREVLGALSAEEIVDRLEVSN